MNERELVLPSSDAKIGFDFYYPQGKEIAGISAQISKITREDSLLAPQGQEEVEGDIRENSYVIIGNGEELFGFSKTNFLAPGWVEASKSYVDPSYRGQGIHTLIKQQIISRNPGANVISITASLAVEHVNAILGFRKQSFHRLPPNVLMALVREYAGSMEKIVFQFKNMFAGKGLWVRKPNL